MIDKKIEVIDKHIKDYKKIDTIKMYLSLYLNCMMSKKTMVEKVDLDDDEIIKGYKLDTIKMYLDLYLNQIISQKRMMEEAGLNSEEEIKQMEKEIEEEEKIYQRRAKINF